MPRKTLIATALTLGLLLTRATAYALKITAGQIIIEAEGGFAPDRAAQARKRPDHPARRRQRLDHSPAPCRRS